MAKRRAQPKIVFDPTKRPPRPSGQVHIDILGASARRREQTTSSGRTDTASITDPTPTSEPSRAETLKLPGELERVIDRIAEGFRQADSTHRAAIDRQVMECFRVANFLKRNWRGGERLLGGEWVKFWGKNGRNGDAALQFVFKKTHSNAKRASFYYRATRKLFEEGVRTADFSARVTKAGGYQELADQNVEKLRGATTTSPPTENGHDSSTRDAETGSKARRRTSSKGAGSRAANPALTDRQAVAHAADSARLITTTASDGVAFFNLPLPCSVNLDVKLWEDASGELLMEVVKSQRSG